MKKIICLATSVMVLLLFQGCEKIVTEYQYVDLGLSVKWAKVNVGATTTTSCGEYFAWGEISPKENYSEKNYRWFDENGRITKYCSNDSYDNPDFLTELEPGDDAAAKLWGGGWRTPTYEEVMELVLNCTWTWSSIDGVRGYKVTSKIPGYEGRYIFLPAAGKRIDDAAPETGYEGQYWSSTNCGKNNSRQSDCLLFNYSAVLNDGFTDGMVRTVGAPIRPVRK